jgi:hypothetical protein
MNLSTISYIDVKTVYGELLGSEQEVNNMPLPGATCSIVAGASTSCCTSCCMAN